MKITVLAALILILQQSGEVPLVPQTFEIPSRYISVSVVLILDNGERRCDPKLTMDEMDEQMRKSNVRIDWADKSSTGFRVEALCDYRGNRLRQLIFKMTDRKGISRTKSVKDTPQREALRQILPGFMPMLAGK